VSTVSLTAEDTRLRDAVIRQLEWDPECDASAIGVAAKDGAVTLTGFIDTYAGKLAAERAAKRVHGTRAVANDVAVRLRLDRTDADIARDAGRALELRSTIPQTVQAVVRDGVVSLSGNVDWLYQKEAAARAVRDVRGVRAVLSHISVTPRAVEKDVHRRIVRALHRHADLDARRIAVTVSGGTATVSGTVETWQHREAAEQAAASAPGIVRVQNDIAVQSLHDSRMDQWDDEC
jgi:osmotically-inducible protein OsmY